MTDSPCGSTWVPLTPNHFPPRSWYRPSWDGRFTAVCSCGRVVEWDAHLLVPVCVCLMDLASQ